MSDQKSKAINLFTCQRNRDYLRTVIPELKDVDENALQSSVNAFANNFISYLSSTEPLWQNVRYLNRLYVQDAEINPPTSTSYSSGGEAIFMSEEINNTLNTNWVDRPCGQGTSQFDGHTWSDSMAGGYMGECPWQRPMDTACTNTSWYYNYRNKYYDKKTSQ